MAGSCSFTVTSQMKKVESGGGGVLEYESDVRVPSSISNHRDLGWKMRGKTGDFQSQIDQNIVSFSDKKKPFWGSKFVWNN